MKFPLPVFLLVTTILHAQDSTLVIPLKDTIDFNRKISFTPDGSSRSLKSLGYYVQPVSDPRLLKFSNGMSILNCLRGQVPNFYLNPQFVTSNPLSTELLMVMDGVPYNTDLADHANLNVFEFDEIISLGLGNAGAAYGINGHYGGVVLKSKTGENFQKPTFAFNSYSSRGWAPSNGAIQGFDEVVVLRSSNSIAYMQDFGKLDTRVSFNFTGVPPYITNPSRNVKANEIIQNVKINTGLDITKRLHARVIAENNSLSEKSRSDDPLSKSTNTYNGTRSFRQANLQLSYDPFSWLNISARTHRMELRWDYHRYIAQIPKWTEKKNVANIFATVDKNISSAWGITMRTGVQSESAWLTTAHQGYKMASFQNALGARFRDQVFMDLTYRIDQLGLKPDVGNKATYSAAAAWTFSETLGWKNNWFAWGKVRTNAARYNWDSTYPFPYTFPNTFFGVPQPQILTNYEAGTDLAFMRGRLQLTFNYIRLVNKDALETVLKDGPTMITFMDYGGTFINLQQVVLGVYPFQQKSWYSRLIWSTVQTGSVSPAGKSTRTYNDSFRDWQASVYNLCTYRDFTWSWLVEINKGGTVRDEANNTRVDATAVRLRDMSFRYSVLKSFTQKRDWSNVSFTLVFRNMKGYYHAQRDYEERLVTNYMYRSISLGLDIEL